MVAPKPLTAPVSGMLAPALIAGCAPAAGAVTGVVVQPADRMAMARVVAASRTLRLDQAARPGKTQSSSIAPPSSHSRSLEAGREPVVSLHTQRAVQQAHGDGDLAGGGVPRANQVVAADDLLHGRQTDPLL